MIDWQDYMTGTLNEAMRSAAQQQAAAGFQTFAQQMPSEESNARMLLLRCMNLLLDARDLGWKARLEGRPPQCRVVFRSKEGKVFAGKPHRTHEGALLLATESLAKYGFLS